MSGSFAVTYALHWGRSTSYKLCCNYTIPLLAAVGSLLKRAATEPERSLGRRMILKQQQTVIVPALGGIELM